MRKILILLAHPKFEHSIVNQALIQAVKDLENVIVHDLYELYPDFNVDVQTEQEVLFVHDVVVFHHPIYWYAAPPLLKQWIDLVLEYSWAYGPGGVYLKNKYVLNAVSSGGTQEAYSQQGKHAHTLREFLLPFEQTAKLCLMKYLPPFNIGGTHKIQNQELQHYSKQYHDLLVYLRDSPVIPEAWMNLESLNNLSY